MGDGGGREVSKGGGGNTGFMAFVPGIFSFFYFLPCPWLDTSARCMGLVVGRLHANVLSEGGDFLFKAFYGFFYEYPTLLPPSRI